MLVESGGDHCREATFDSGKGTHGLHFVTHRLATTAHHALVHIADDRRRNLNLVGGLFVTFTNEGILADTEADGQSLELAVAALGALEAIVRVVAEDELKDGFAGVDHADGVGANDHTFHTFGDASGSEVSALLNFDDADTASAGFVVDIHAFEFKVAKGGDVDAHALCGFKNGSPFRNFNFSIIDG